MSSPLPSTAWQKYDSYSLNTDPKQGDRATELKWCNFQRPHMRAFYVSTFGFFIAFTSWFSFAGVMPEVKHDLGLTKDEVNNANIAAVSATVVARFVIGPLCDVFGARQTFAALLFLGAIPTYCSGLVQTATDLAIIRFFIGILGATFVCNQAWSSLMFSKEIIGKANGTSAGWGNLGGGMTHIMMAGLWEGFKTVTSSENAWRISFVVPATIVMLSSFSILFFADDSPKGDFKELVHHGAMVRKSSKKSASLAWTNANSYIMALQYGVSFGLELVVFNISTTYFVDKFGMTLTKAALISAVFGFLNVISRSAGGILSDFLHKRFGSGHTGMRGRILAQFICVAAEGALLCVFSRMDQLASAIVVLVFFAFAVQMANGTNYSIVPYVCPEATGAVSGLVGAGGNLGAVIFGLIFRFGPKDPADVFLILGFVVLASTLSLAFVSIKGHNGAFRGAKGEPAAIDTI